MAIGLIPGDKLLGKLGGFVSNIGSSAWRTAKDDALSHGGPIFRAAADGAGRLIGSLAERASRWIAKGCGCFEAGHLVWTTRGPIPIERVTTDDVVFAQDEATGQVSLRRVIDTFVRRGAPIVAVTVMTAGGHAETFRTTSEHPFYVPIDGWVQVDQLRPGDATTTLGGSEAVVVGISYTGEQAEVFNLEVEGLHDYYVGASGVLVHNTNDACLTWIGRVSKITSLTKGTNKRVFLASDENALKKLFDELADGASMMKAGDRTFANLPDGSFVQFRRSSKSQGAALDFKTPDGTEYKVHVP